MARFACVCLFLIVALNSLGAASADGAGACSSGSDGYTVHTTCVRSGSETNAYISAHSEHTYSIRPACEVGGLALCAAPGTCSIDGHDGNLFNVYEDGAP